MAALRPPSLPENYPKFHSSHLRGLQAPLSICRFNTIIHATQFILLYLITHLQPFLHLFSQILYASKPSWGMNKMLNKIYLIRQKGSIKKNVLKGKDHVTWTPSWNGAPPAALSNLQTYRRQSWSGRRCTGRNHSRRRTHWPSSGRLDKERQAALHTYLQSSFLCPGLQWCGCCWGPLQKSAKVIFILLKSYFQRKFAVYLS